MTAPQPRFNRGFPPVTPPVVISRHRPTIEAQFRSRCEAGCGEVIEQGQAITQDDDGSWVHEECHGHGFYDYGATPPF